MPADPATATTLRQVVRVTAGGRQLRIRLPNAPGAPPPRVAGGHVGLSAAPGSTAIRPGSDRPVLFPGAVAATVPAGADYRSDPVAVPVVAGDSLAVSKRLAVPDAPQTIHSASHATSFIAAGDRLSAPDLPGAARVEHWGGLSGVDVARDRPRLGIVAFGDSITDGSWSTTDGNGRWPEISSRTSCARTGTARSWRR